MVEGVACATGFRQLVADLVPDPTVCTMAVATDSTCALSLVRRQGASRKTRHVEVKCFYVQGVARLPWVRFEKVGTRSMYADPLTKVGLWDWGHYLFLGMGRVKVVEEEGDQGPGN